MQGGAPVISSIDNKSLKTAAAGTSKAYALI